MSTEDLVIITQPAGSRTLALRESYLGISRDDVVKALLLNANERWYKYKLKEREQARHRNKVARDGGETPDADEGLWVFMSGEQWAAELLGVAEVKTVRRKMAELVEDGFLSVRDNPTKKWDKKKQWLFNRAAVQAAVDAWTGTRPTPDLDPSEADGVTGPVKDGSDDVDMDSPPIRTIVSIEADKTENGSGQNGASIRTNGMSNTTGISPRDLSQESFPGGDAHEANAQPSSAARSSSGVAARETAGGQISPAASVAVLPPDGGAADAANGHTLSEIMETSHPGRQDGQATDTAEVPGAAGGPSGDQGSPAAPSVDALRPIPTPELSTRVPARPESAEYRALLTLFGKNLGGYLQEYTRTGSIPRTQWLRLTLAELDLVRDTAQGEARATQGNMLTLAVRGLDRLIGAVAAPRTAASGSARPAVATVTPNGSSLNGFKPTEQVQDVASTDRYGQGARWQARDGGAVLTIQRTSDKPTKTGKATLYHLSDGRTVNAMELMRDFDHVG
ncbi:hypothetical protein [Deinococcus radiotolerans]|uniref:Uncharacterized protein n=1 Tax=Deinococcus radiotolerans TaxID=1309407 RepID=A0ABQ2FQ36_9DEIO|nr:hypothetical protein [Deinococcus radiotolerans]GGL15625.1 hypothetical protein GCM10010844_38180 [Deinococcus radiotolerans]